jgi:hypothetical protein
MLRSRSHERLTAMDRDFLAFLAAFVVVVALFAIGIRFLLPMIAQHLKGAAGGWGRFSRVYATTRRPPAPIFRRQSLVVGQILYRNCVNVGSDGLGLYLELAFPMTILRRRPLFVPWMEFQRVDAGRLFWRKAALISLGDPLVGTMTAPMDLFNAAIRPAIGTVLTPLADDGI